MIDLQTVLESAPRTATATSKEMTNRTGRGIVLALDVSDKTSSPNISSIQIQTRGMGSNWVTIFQFSGLGIGATGAWTYCVYPGAQDGYSAEPQRGVIPALYRVVVTHDNTDSITYSLQAAIIP